MSDSAERVAQALGDKFFHEAQLVPKDNLAGDLEVKVVLGRV